jgi:hypothetical protein
MAARADTPSSTLNAASLSALAEADAVDAAARRAAGLSSLGIAAPDLPTLTADLRGLASWVSAQQSAGVPNPPIPWSVISDQIQLGLNTLNGLPSLGQLPDPQGFLTLANQLLAETRTVILFGLPPVGPLPNPPPVPTTDQLMAEVNQLIADSQVRIQYGLPPIDVGSLVPQLPSVLTYVEAQAGQLVGDVQTTLANLPSPQALLTTIEQEEAVLVGQIPKTPDVDLSGLLLQADQVYLALGQIVAGPLSIPGPTFEQAANEAGAVNDAVTYAINSTIDTQGVDSGALTDTAANTIEDGVDNPVPDSLTVAGAAGFTHGSAIDAFNLAISTAGSAGGVAAPTPDLDPQIAYDAAQDAAAATTGYRCYMFSYQGACAPPMTWHSGSVQHNPKVYVIFWGPQWSNLGSQKYAVTSMFGGMSGSGFQSVLSQYYDATATISPTMTFGGSFQDNTPPLTNVVTTHDYVNEAIKIARANNLHTSDDTQWVFYPQPGIASDDGASKSLAQNVAHCGYHGSGADNTGRKWVVSVVDYPAQTSVFNYQAGCIDNKIPDANTDLTFSGSHEYAEAATDPFGNGWYDQNSHEIGDMCRTAWPSGGETLLWSNNGSVGSCTQSFTPRYTYVVNTSLTYPPNGEAPSGLHARGHAYDGGQVVATNTGNMPWFPVGRHATYLGTWNSANRCSHMADMNSRDPSNPWRGCNRVKLTGTTPIEPRSVAVAENYAYASVGTFALRAKLDGAYHDGATGSESFNLVSSVWMSPSSGSTPTLALKAAVFNAKFVAPATGKPIVAGVAGTDVPVQLDYNVLGTAPWFSNEVAYLGTTDDRGVGHSSPFAASTWPKSSACSNCRAARVSSTTEPGATYSFKFNIHIPATMATGRYTEYFRPVADVPINGGGIDAHFFGTVVPVSITVVGVPVGSHQVTADGTIGSEPAQGADTTDLTAPDPYGHWYMCTAIASPDALSTTIDSCSITVTHANGATEVFSAGPSSSTGAVETEVGTVTYDSTAGDTAQLCWQAHATYADQSTQSTSGCTSG